VDAAIGAPGDGHADGRAQDRLKGSFQLALDGALSGLGSPARERAAVILEKELRVQTSSR